MAVLHSLGKISNKFLLHNNLSELFLKCNSNLIQSRLNSYVSKEYNEDPADKFLNNEVQTALRTLTRVDMNRVFRKRKLGDSKLDIPKYQFMTSEELQAAMETAQKKVDELMQMPPVVKIRATIDRVLSKTPELQGYDTASYVFTDITFGCKNKDRLIVVREPDGTLRDGDCSLRERMNQIYFPTPGRLLYPPKMFEESKLNSLLDRSEYEYVLDRACVQYEPESTEYQRVTSVTYQHIYDNNRFDCIRSTRHFGPFVFFLAWHKTIDNLLLELIETAHIVDGNALLKLYGILNGIQFNITDINSLDVIEKYVDELSIKKAPLQLAIQAFKDIESQRNELERGIQTAHGIV